MIAHITLHVNDASKAKEFYLNTLAPMGYKASMEFPEGGPIEVVGFKSGEGNHDFWINGDGAKQPTHVAFVAISEKMVQDFYDAALKAGAKDNGAPGYRTEYGAGYYAAFVLDPDGHNIEAMYWNEDKK